MSYRPISLPHAKIATAITFIINGVLTGTLVSRIPDMKSTLHISDATMGTALFFIAAGVLTALSPGSRLAAKYGSAPMMVLSTIGLVIAFPMVGLLFNLPYFEVTLVIYGLFAAFQDVTMNSHAVAIENSGTNRIMSKMHAMWSVGTVISGAIGGFIAQRGLFTISPFSPYG